MTEIIDYGIKGLKVEHFYAGDRTSKDAVNSFMKDKIVYFVLMEQMMLWVFYVDDDGGE